MRSFYKNKPKEEKKLSTIYSTVAWLKVHAFVILLLSVSSCAQKKKQNAKNHYHLAMIELSENNHGIGNWKKALSHIDDAIIIEPKAEYFALKATILFMLKHKKSSAYFFDRALQVSEDGPVKKEILNNYACMLAESGKSDEALEIWKKLVSSDDYLTPEVALINQGKVLMKRGHLKKARKSFSKALTYAPGYLDAQYFLALAEIELKNTSVAQDLVKTILYLDKNNQGALLLAKKLGLNQNDALLA